MTAASKSERLFRVLCLFPHPRFTGHAVLDEIGLVRSATFTMRTRRFPTLPERIASIELQLRQSVATYRPDVVAIIATTGCAWVETTTAQVLTAATATGVRLRVVAEPELEELFRVPDGAEYDQLGQSVTSVFFPELMHDTGSWRRGTADVRRRVRPMWKAAAGAIAVLAEHRPASTAKLARGPLPPGLASLIERASRAPIT